MDAGRYMIHKFYWISDQSDSQQIVWMLVDKSSINFTGSVISRIVSKLYGCM